ncbi:2-polyprenyl-6-methoxyphenol hydroxylase [Legionella rubrilucens]|uniref:2-polyprenyl-6-methoxyphenol hydroxylase n=1 Tax=Legionella rubrilucens TaxID=458 RepID=A0A0W0XND8_9GAMM|nr:FAD-dependent monooxygenase [Legionella rubrilucens]KTD45923.1 2-polyprenyl-6-methoxyphenol hydroxylase [Legionella rubrilucens]
MQVIYDGIVVGGGVVGLTAALAMAERGLDMAVIDAGSLTAGSPAPDVRVYAINQASESLLRELKVWELMVPSRLSPYQHMHVWDAANGASIDFDARMIAANKLGTIIEESVIKQALLLRLQEQGKVVLLPHQEIVNVNTDGPQVTVASSSMEWQSQLLLIADGANSATRQKLRVGLTSWPYHQHAVIATVETEKPHEQTAYQVFNRDGPLAFLPLADSRHCSIVWSTSPARAQQLLDLNPDGFNQQLAKAFAHKLGTVTLRSERYQFPLVMRHARQYTGKNWLLLGDAAHTIHPLAGLGLNIGLADVSAWLDCLASGRSLTSPRLLTAYQRHRRHAVWQSIALMDALKGLFANPLPPVRWVRGLGLSCCDRLLLVKRLFIAHAAGKRLVG